MEAKRKTVKVGFVVSKSGDKTINVLVERLVKHPFYKKVVKKRKKFLAHDENNTCNVGDKVKIIESRPLSRRKRWIVIEIISKMRERSDSI
ncbi:MAG: 30S ribosomal protein S17 [Candidatus Aminicenantia bacterium]